MNFLDAIRECCAGLDVHQANVVVCVLSGPLDRKPKKQIREFSTVLSGLLELQASCKVTVANASHIKNLPGRKTDIKDAQWIAELHRCGLIRGSFIAPPEIRQLRDLTRYRKKLKGYETSERNRILKILEDANIKITTFMSDVFGVSGRLMLDALVNGETIEPSHVAELAKGKLRPKIPEK